MFSPFHICKFWSSQTLDINIKLFFRIFLIYFFNFCYIYIYNYLLYILCYLSFIVLLMFLRFFFLFFFFVIIKNFEFIIPSFNIFIFLLQNISYNNFNISISYTLSKSFFAFFAQWQNKITVTILLCNWL